jgi:hypothetical protein
MAEMYTLQRYLAPMSLEVAGVEHFDAWAANFGEAVTALELAPDGSGYRMHTRFAKFVNLPELLSMFRSFRGRADGGHAASSPARNRRRQAAYHRRARLTGAERIRPDAGDPRAEAKTSKIDPSVDNMLKITGDGRKAALDMRLVDPFAEIHGDTKVSRAVENIYRTWEQGRDRRSAQLVFCDLSTPNPDRFNVYDDIREKLIAKGVPSQGNRLYPRRG